MNPLLPTSDLAFKKTFASPENKDILQGLIVDFFHVYPKVITLSNPYSIKAYKEVVEGTTEISVFRETARDVTASLEFADYIMEMQVKALPFFEERLLYYVFNKYCDNYNSYIAMPGEIGKGKKINRYATLKPVYALNILGDNHFTSDDDALRMFELYDPVREKRLGKELLKVGFFELKKQVLETENHRYWQHFFTTGQALEASPAYIKKAVRVMDFARWTKEEQQVAMNYEKAVADRDAREYTLWQEGRQEGRLEGRQEGRLEGQLERAIEIAKNALKEGASVDFVQKISGLDRATIESLTTTIQ